LPQSSLQLQGLVVTFDFIVTTLDIAINLASIATSARELAGSLSTSVARVLDNGITSDRYFNLYAIYVDHFNYMRSLSHKHQSRGAGDVLEDQFISDDEVLSDVRERRLEDVAATFDHGYSNYVRSWSRVYCGVYRRTSSSRMMEFYTKLRREATR
jgi:hypothetical protein